MSASSPLGLPTRGPTTTALPTEISRTLRLGSLRLRADRSLAGGVAGLAVGLVGALLLAITIRLRPLMLQDEAVLWAIGMVVAGVLLGAAVGWLLPAPRSIVAQRADRACGLLERISTALELHSGVIHGPLHAAQLRDAVASAATVTRMPRLGPKLVRRDAGVVAGLAVAVALTLWLPNPQSDSVRERRADAEAVEEARDSHEVHAAEIAARPDLDPATQAALTARLDDLLEKLEPGSLTSDDAAAELAAAEGDLRRLEQTDAAAQAQTLRDSAPLLQTSGATADTGNALAAGDLAAAAAAMSALGEEAQDLSPEEQQALANRLNEMAAQQQAANPELASALAAAAAALASGNPSEAAASLNNAAAAILSVADAQAANAAAAAASSSLASTRQSLGYPNRTGSTQGTGAAGTPSAGSGSSSGSASGTPQAGSGSSGSSSSSGSGTPTSGSGQSGSAGGNMGMSGQVQGSSAQTTSGGTNSGNAQPQQGEDGQTGSRDEEPIYAPSTQSGAQGQEDFIAGVEGPGNEEISAQTGTGAVTDASVPYSAVYGEYERQASRDIEQGAVPAPLQPYVRDYFSALEPGTGSSATGEEEQP